MPKVFEDFTSAQVEYLEWANKVMKDISPMAELNLSSSKTPTSTTTTLRPVPFSSAEVNLFVSFAEKIWDNSYVHGSFVVPHYYNKYCLTI